MFLNIETTVNRWALSLSEQGLNIRVMALRSLVNSSTTVYRCHKAVILPCVFGCSKLCPKPAKIKSANLVLHTPLLAGSEEGSGDGDGGGGHSPVRALDVGTCANPQIP